MQKNTNNKTNKLSNKTNYLVQIYVTYSNTKQYKFPYDIKYFSQIILKFNNANEISKKYYQFINIHHTIISYQFLKFMNIQQSEDHDSQEYHNDNQDDDFMEQEENEPPIELPQENVEEIKKIENQIEEKKKFVHKLKKQSEFVQTIDQQMETLLKQAQFYANFLLSHHESAKNRQRQDKSNNKKKRGRFEQQQEEEKHILEQEQEEVNNNPTHLSKQPNIIRGGQLKFYQMVGLNWLISLYQSGINGILADDMGLGKTIQTIAIIAFLRQYKKINGPHLIIAPKITLGNWVREFEKWLPSCKVVKLIATKQQRQGILDNYISKGKFDVVVTSFEGARICLKHLKRIRWKYLIIDQAHKIKNEQSMLSQVVRMLNTSFKLLLTGTPLQNNLHELWSLLNFILPDIFDSSELFDTWFSANSEKNGELSKQDLQKKNIEMIQQLHKILRPFMLRRTKKQVQKSLPEKKQIHVYVGLTDTQVKIYKSLLQNRSSAEDEKKFYLNLLMQLRKVCNHPYLFQGIQAQGSPALGEHLIQVSGKMIVLDLLLKKLYVQKHQVLIFSQMTMVLDILEDYCNFRGFKYCRIDGSTDMDSRDRQINQFSTEGTDRFVFLLSTRAGGLGINLTAADTVIIYDSDWNPQMDLQAMDRAHRIGQKNMVNVYRLITQNTVQQKIIQRQTIKLKWDSLVIQQGRMATQKNKILSKQQMKDMLQFGASVIFKADTQKGTISEEEIDQLLKRGQSRTQKLNQEIQKKVKQNATALDLGMNSINIFDFMMDNKNKDDAEALDEALARQLQNEARARRDKNKGANYNIDAAFKNLMTKNQKQRISKKILLPEHHFYDQKDYLLELMQKQEDYNTFKSYDSSYHPLTQQEQQKKAELLTTGFPSWSKNDFHNFISATEKFGKNAIAEIAHHVNKPLDEISNYSKTFWSRIDELVEHERIKKQIATGEQKMHNRAKHSLLLDWKSAQGYEIDFNPGIYTKFRSKLFTIEADKFLVQHLYKFGIANMTQVRDKIRTESIFRFDHFFRSRTESQLNKRMQSLYKLIQKQKDIEANGIEGMFFKERETKKQKRTTKTKIKDQEFNERILNNAIMQESVEQIKNNNEIKEVKQYKQIKQAKKIQKLRQQTAYGLKKQTIIQIDESDD